MTYAATALLTGYARPDALLRTIESIKSQSVPVQIFLVSNTPPGGGADVPDVDLNVRVSGNLMCWPRWFLANYAEARYVFTMDDDISFTDSEVVNDCINFANNHECAVGSHGVRLHGRQVYSRAEHLEPKLERDVEVDIIKGRFFMVAKQDLMKLPMIPFLHTSTYDASIEDDIAVSSHLAKKIIPSLMRDRTRSAGSGFEGLCARAGHMNARDNAARYWFG